MSRRLVLSLVAVSVLGGCAGKPAFVHTRPLVTQSDLMSDIEACRLVGNTTPTGQAAPTYSGSPAAAFGSGLAEGYVKAKAMQTGYERCMADRGYLQTTLTAEDNAAFKALKTEDERKAWLAAFAARDHGERSVRMPEAVCRPNLLVACN